MFLFFEFLIFVDSGNVGGTFNHIYLCVSVNLYVYLLMCVSSFSCLLGTYVYNLIISLFSGASLGAAPARRLFLRKNFLI